MTESPLVSIIIPTYNRATIITETLESILTQTYRHWECIIVDDGSTDDTAGLMAGYMKKDSRFQYYIRPDEIPKGPCSCRNYGFEKSRGPYINFFDSDDLFTPTALEKAVSVFSEEADAVIMNSALTDLKTGVQISRNTICSTNLLTDYFIGSITFLVCGPLWKRSFLEEQPYLFDVHIRNIDDWDFNLRMLYQNPRLVYINEVLIYYRMHDNSFSKEVRKLNKLEIASDFAARDKHLYLIGKRDDINLKIIHRYLIYRYKRYMRWAIEQKSGVNIFTFLTKELIGKQVVFHNYWGALKSGIGYIFLCFSGRGYMFFKE